MVVYAKTSAAVKARADWMVTSSCAVSIVKHLHAQGEKISLRPIVIWAATWPSRPGPICFFGRVIRTGDLTANEVVCRISGSMTALVTAERSALNFLQMLSGVATQIPRYVKAIEGLSPDPRGCRILDTRKTMPGLRHAQKYAVRMGGRNQPSACLVGCHFGERKSY